MSRGGAAATAAISASREKHLMISPWVEWGISGRSCICAASAYSRGWSLGGAPGPVSQPRISSLIFVYKTACMDSGSPGDFSLSVL